MNFNYVVQRQEKPKVCFGSGLERKLLHDDVKGMVSRHATHNRKENLPVAPGMYEISYLTSALSSVMNRPTSKLGTVLGGRKAVRKFYTLNPAPPPGTYNIPSTFPDEFVQMYAPFNSTTERKQTVFPNVPGVGTYKGGIYKKRRTTFKHSFGGETCLQPSVKVKCGPFNFDECERCQKYPEGDYWYLDTIGQRNFKTKKVKEAHRSEGTFLCRDCYEIEKKQNKIFSKAQIQNFKKIRDCSKIHFHDGCKGKLFLVPPQEIAKLKQREAYLSLFFK